MNCTIVHDSISESLSIRPPEVSIFYLAKSVPFEELRVGGGVLDENGMDFAK